MDRLEALGILGLTAEADGQAVREAHRRRIRETHPDLGGTAHEAAQVNEALLVAQSTPVDGDSIAPPPPDVRSPSTRPDDVDRFFLIDERPTALLARLAEAGHHVGEVVFVDPHVGILEIVVGTPPAVGQLAVTVGDEGAEGTPVSFTLDALGVTEAPPIETVVAALMDALSR